MKKKRLIALIAGCVIAATGIAVAAISLLSGGLKVVLDGPLDTNSVIEYTGEKIQFPVAHIENRAGGIVSYDVDYRVTSLDTGDEFEDEYATFSLKVGKYEIDYIYRDNKSIRKTVSFSVADTIAPEITFADVPNGLFLQDIDKDDSHKLPSYLISDASELDGVDIERMLYFQGENDKDYKECAFREINNSYDITDFGKFKYSVTATDVYGNQNIKEVEWKVKDRDWKPSKMPPTGYLADYSSEGYTNLVEGGDANQYYKIGNDYSDDWLEKHEGAEGVLKVDMGFNNAAGYGNNTLKLRFARNFTKDDIEGKYLAVRMYLDAEHLTDQLLFAGVNVEIREDGINRAFTTSITGIETGKWVTYYIDADLVEHIGMYPNARYNPATTFYEGGDAATALQLCFQRKSGYNDGMTLYVDSITLAEKLPDTVITISGQTAKWDAVEGAAGYKVILNGEETTTEETSVNLDGSKGYIRVTPLGDGALTLDGEEVSAVYGLDAGNKLAAFDDELYIQLFSDKLKFSTSNEHIGYKPSSVTGSKTASGVTMELGASSWGVCNGVRLQFPEAKAKGSNTAVRITMSVSDAKYRVMRIYDYDGQLLQSIDLDSSNTGRYFDFDVDLATYDKPLAGLQFIFGPSEGMVNVPEGVTLKFESIEYVNNYYEITVGGKKLTCAGKRALTPGYTQSNLVQFTSVYNFGVPKDDTPLSFSGTVLLDGKKIEKVSVVGYPNTDTICFKVPHQGKVLTIKEGSVIYYKNKAIEVEETFNAKWDGSKWVAASEIPNAPAKKYVTIDGVKMEVVDSVVLTPGYTTNDLVQFIDFYDLGAPQEDTPFSFKGTVMLDGKEISNANVVGYKDNTTITFKVPHNGKVLTVLQDSYVYYGKKAVQVKETFNAKWDGTKWIAVEEVPAPPKKEYITVDGEKKEVVEKVILTPGYTTDSLVQFTNVYDFGVDADDTPLSFSGTILLDGAKQNSVNLVGYKNHTTICLKNILHKDKVLTIKKNAVIYVDDKAVVVKKTFNAKWNGINWVEIDQIPTPPKKEYVTVDGEQKEVVAKVALTAGYTTDSLVQFTNVYDFGVDADDTPLQFSGAILLDGVVQNTVNIVGYKNNTTICLKNVALKNKVLTIKKNAVIYVDDKAVVVKDTFNAKWDGTQWNTVDKIPTPPEKEYVTVDGVQKELVATVTLNAGYTTGTLVQFTNVYDFGVPTDNTKLTFSGEILLDGVVADFFDVIGYVNNTTICFNIPHGEKVLTIKEGSFIYYGDKAVKVKETFNKKWNLLSNNWTDVSDIPTPPQEDKELILKGVHYGIANQILIDTNLPNAANCSDFLATDNGNEIKQSGNQMVGYFAMNNFAAVDGKKIMTLVFNQAFTAGQTYKLEKGSRFVLGDGAYVLKHDYEFTYDGNAWTMEEDPVNNVATITFAAMSDVHMGDTGTSAKFESAMQYFSGLSVKPETYLFVGDLTNSTGGSGSAVEISDFKTIYEKYASPSEMLYCLGPTHDVPADTDPTTMRELFQTTFGTAYFANDLESADGLRHTKKNGFHFISIEWDSTNNGTLTSARKEWLKTQLDAAVSEDANKPIFVITHVPNEASIDEVLGNYPQVICFTGHTHNSIAREDSITQDKGFTQIHCGGMNYYRVDGYNRFTSDPYLNLGDVYDFAQALYVQVSADNTVTVTRKDVKNQTDIGEPWVISPTRREVYTVDRLNTAERCQFATTAVLDIEEIGNAWLEVSWDAAQMGEAGPAIYYQVQLLAPDKDGVYQVVEHKELSSQQVFYPNDEGIPSLHYSYLFKNCLNSLDDYAVVVTAQDCWKQSKNALVYTNGTYVSSIPSGGTVNLHERDLTEDEIKEVVKTLSFKGVHYGIANQFLIETNLTDSANCSDFLATDNGNDIKQSGDKQVGYFAMHNFSAVDGKKIVTPVFNSDFAAGESYTLHQGSKFVFKDGTYILDKNYTFSYDGSSWKMESYSPLSFKGVHYGIANQFMIETNLEESANCSNFLATDNGNDIKQSGDKQVGYFAMHNFSAVDGKKIITPVFNSDFAAGELYTLKEGSKFVLGDGTYVLDKDYTFTYDGSGWTMEEGSPTPPPAEVKQLALEYRWGASNVIQFNTNLPTSTPLVNFTTSDNGCNIDQSGNQYQQVGWIQMDRVDDTTILTFHFNSEFSAGQTYVLPKGAVFGFTDGNKYELDKDYTVVFNGSEWSIQESLPTLELTYRWGANNVIQYNTNLPTSTPLANFLATDNGCEIDQSGNQYQQVGWIQMDRVGDTTILTFHFNSEFSAGQTYVLPKGAVFGFTDGNKYQLDKGYTLAFNGSEWAAQ